GARGQQRGRSVVSPGFAPLAPSGSVGDCSRQRHCSLLLVLKGEDRRDGVRCLGLRNPGSFPVSFRCVSVNSLCLCGEFFLSYFHHGDTERTSNYDTIHNSFWLLFSPSRINSHDRINL